MTTQETRKLLNELEAIHTSEQFLSQEDFCKFWKKYRQIIIDALEYLNLRPALKIIIQALIKLADNHCAIEAD